MEKLLGNTTRRPDITFYKNGRIDITARVARLLGISRGDVIDICTDGYEYYLYVRLHASGNNLGRHEAQCIPTNRSPKCRNFRTYSSRLCKIILERCNAKERIAFPIGELVNHYEVGKAVTIITNNNILL
ncbi:hypothetical protein OCV73_00055 [Barnesiella propionica]|uniref:hypothetical protein n=1 Tax=Barnesiella propionica TaxID=2981781 RepID=UPI0011C95965|nr:hypothetical protein [Barnesiella propionica]MCU6767354.1 hypothetical protein [Barnesiella propionica]